MHLQNETKQRKQFQLHPLPISRLLFPGKGGLLNLYWRNFPQQMWQSRVNIFPISFVSFFRLQQTGFSCLLLWGANCQKQLREARQEPIRQKARNRLWAPDGGSASDCPTIVRSTRVGEFRFHGEAANEPTEGAGLGSLSLVIVLFSPRSILNSSPRCLES